MEATNTCMMSVRGNYHKLSEEPISLCPPLASISSIRLCMLAKGSINEALKDKIIRDCKALHNTCTPTLCNFVFQPIMVYSYGLIGFLFKAK